jgi:hypothetical protein
MCAHYDLSPGAINENKGNPVPHGGLGLGAFNLGTDAII